MHAPGVGLVYWPALEPLFREGTEAVSALVLEPQTLWEKLSSTNDGLIRYRTNEAALGRVAALPQRKLLHGVGHPVGGSVDDSLDYITPFAQAVHALKPAWVSEHLSFNRISREGHVEETGFLLPPRQTREGVRQAVRNIRRFVSMLSVHFAFETGVNYLQPRADELSDGEFFASIARAAPCGIVLDLHNLWANERNGREPVSAVLDALPLDQVWEIHLAGGMELDGYWLDAHSGAIPSALIDLAATVIPRVPNLSAIIFEILPQYIPVMGLAAIMKQVELMKELWGLRLTAVVPIKEVGHAVEWTDIAGDSCDVVAWEEAVAAIAQGRSATPCPFPDLEADAGTDILRQLIIEFRRSSIARGMRYTMTMLLMTRGRESVRNLVDQYCRATPPDLFTAVECDNFARFLLAHDTEASQPSLLTQILAFESALLRASLRGETTELHWSVDPVQLFGALDEGRMPIVSPCPDVTMTITAGS